MELITKEKYNTLENIVKMHIASEDVKKFENEIIAIYQEIHESIPQKKRISYGSYYVVKIIGDSIYKIIEKLKIDGFKIFTLLLNFTNNRKVKGIALEIISLYGLSDLEKVYPIFEKFSTDDDWEVREFAAGFFCKLTKKYPDDVRNFYLKMVKSTNPMKRRFVSESLRPVGENMYLVNNPQYSLSIIKHLFKERSPYPRTSVGNKLSDIARNHKELVFKIVEKLVKSGDKNSYWIAYRACRNLVKTEPVRVMDILKINEYKYKTRIHKRNDY